MKNTYEKTLQLEIHCIKCNSYWRPSAESIALAIIAKKSIWEYIEAVQDWPCKQCFPNAKATIKVKKRKKKKPPAMPLSDVPNE